MIEDDKERAKRLADHGAPLGADMIRLVPPAGKPLVRTAEKGWTRER
jgi:hypothetical protein